MGLSKAGRSFRVLPPVLRSLAFAVLSLGAGLVATGDTPAYAGADLTTSDAIVIEAEDGTVIEGLRITSRDTHCILVRDSANITIRNSVIGPCEGQGIFIEGGSGVTISGNTIQTQYKPAECCDEGDGILALRTSDLVIDENRIAYSETNIQLQGVDGAAVTNNSLANPLGPFPRGQQIQVAGGGTLPESRDVLIEGNMLISSRDDAYRFEENQEDAINLYFAQGVTVRNNRIQGGSSPSGCGILVDDGANRATVSNNRLFNTGQCGIGIASGTAHVVDSNRVLMTREIEGGGNAGIYTWNQYTLPCAGIFVTNNVVTFLREDGTHNGFWDGGGCEPVTLTNNTLDEDAYTILRPEFVGISEGLTPEFVPLDYADSGVSSLLGPGLLMATGVGFLAAVAFLLRGRSGTRGPVRPGDSG